MKDDKTLWGHIRPDKPSIDVVWTNTSKEPHLLRGPLECDPWITDLNLKGLPFALEDAGITGHLSGLKMGVLDVITEMATRKIWVTGPSSVFNRAYYFNGKTRKVENMYLTTALGEKEVYEQCVASIRD